MATTHKDRAAVLKVAKQFLVGENPAGSAINYFGARRTFTALMYELSRQRLSNGALSEPEWRELLEGMGLDTDMVGDFLEDLAGWDNESEDT